MLLLNFFGMLRNDSLWMVLQNSSESGPCPTTRLYSLDVINA